MQEIINSWWEDIPQQFKGKERIEILLNAFAKQLQEVANTFDDIDKMTTLDNAVGVHLDNIGDIMCLSRREATAIIKNGQDMELTDEIYRSVLRYQGLKNNCDCTYDDIMHSISLLWDVDKVDYLEKPSEPATIFINLPQVNVDAIDPAIGRILAIRPSGVHMIYYVSFFTEFMYHEEIKVPKIVLRTEFNYFDLKYLDGKWYLDGSVLLAESININIALRIGVIEVLNVESSQSRRIRNLSYIKNEEKTSIKRITNNFEFNYFGLKYLDGKWYLDGSGILDQKTDINILLRIGAIEVLNVESSQLRKLNNKSNIKNDEKISISTIRTKYDFNYYGFRYLNGKWYLDGSESLNHGIEMNMVLKNSAIKFQNIEKLQFEKIRSTFDIKNSEKIVFDLASRTTFDEIEKIISSQIILNSNFKNLEGLQRAFLRHYLSVKNVSSINIEHVITRTGFKMYEDVLNTKQKSNIHVTNKEEVQTQLVIAKNLWYLNGEIYLDSSKLLNAQITKEEL